MATNLFFGKKSIRCQHATQRTTNEIWITIMIIAWWYSNKFLSLPIILFLFYSIFLLAFQYLHAVIICLPVISWVLFHFIYLPSSVSPCGDYLPAGDSVSFILFYLLAFQCLHAVIICLPDMDRTSVLVLAGRCWQSICFSCTERDLDHDHDHCMVIFQ